MVDALCCIMVYYKVHSGFIFTTNPVSFIFFLMKKEKSDKITENSLLISFEALKPWRCEPVTLTKYYLKQKIYGPLLLSGINEYTHFCKRRWKPFILDNGEMVAAERLRSMAERFTQFVTFLIEVDRLLLRLSSAVVRW